MTSHLAQIISEEAILKKIASFASDIHRYFNGEEIVLVMILKGSICFAADLMRHLTLPFTLEMIRCESYGLRGMQRGNLKVTELDTLSIKGKNVLLLDDIYDTGHTLHYAKTALLALHPKTIITAALLDKKVEKLPGSSVDHCLFTIENEIVVGYGLDYNEHYRGLRGIYSLKLHQEERS